MIASMTGFGKAEASDGKNRAVVEIKTVNSRYSDLSIRLPQALSNLDLPVKKVVQGSISRGRIEVTISYEGANGGMGVPVLNLDVARGYLDGLSRLHEAFGLKEAVDPRIVAPLPEVFRYVQDDIDLNSTWPLIQEATKSALDQCNRMRRTEGDHLRRDFEKRIENLELIIKKVEGLAPARVKAGRDRIRERISQVLTEELDEGRLAVEVAILADRMDITEECVRFHCHDDQFLNLLEREEPVGRRLNFLLQEMGREANTIGSKANEAAISHLVVELKEEIERLREQVQNVE